MKETSLMLGVAGSRREVAAAALPPAVRAPANIAEDLFWGCIAW